MLAHNDSPVEQGLQAKIFHRKLNKGTYIEGDARKFETFEI